MNEHFSALSLLLCLNWPGDIVIMINDSAMIIISMLSENRSRRNPKEVSH